MPLKLRARLTYANVMATIAVFLALGGGAYAAATIDGRSIKKNSIPGSRLKKDTVTGRKIRESSLGRVPTAKNSANAQTLGGRPRSALGAGVVSGSLYGVPNGTSRVQPYGYFAFGSADFFAVDAVAPVTLTVRDFVANVESLNSGSVSFSLYVVSGAGVKTTPLCQVSSGVTSCRAPGPIAIARDASYRIQTDGTGVSANAAVGYQYRAAPG